MAAVLLSLVACSCTPATGATTTPPEPTTATTPEDSTPAEGPATPSPEPWDEQQAFMTVFTAMRTGDWAEFEPFAGASIAYERSYSISEEPPERTTIAAGDARAWLTEVAATWAPQCIDDPGPPCRSFNPLSLGTPDEQIPQLTCDAGCCRHEPAMLHNTPFLAELCFDEDHRLSRVVVIDG